MYEVHTVAVLALGSSEITVHNQHLPVVEHYTRNSIQLSVTIDSDLVNNELYSASITSKRDGGLDNSIGIVRFSKSEISIPIFKCLLIGIFIYIIIYRYL